MYLILLIIIIINNIKETVTDIPPIFIPDFGNASVKNINKYNKYFINTNPFFFYLIKSKNIYK